MASDCSEAMTTFCVSRMAVSLFWMSISTKELDGMVLSLLSYSLLVFADGYLSSWLGLIEWEHSIAIVALVV